ncbi:MAG TPA: molecular chaperone DnaJ [Nitriliruptorales bacterium]|nr:molecular chaperone DnaJ [Nitriliruptorales bacterium]
MPPQRDWLEKDFYEVLGVPEEASQADIKKAYRRLSRELHPDANRDDPRAEERFKEVGEAYSVLGNEDKRKEYDELRRLAASGAFAGGFPGAGGPGGFTFAEGDLGDLSDLLGNLFGRGGGFTGARRARRQRKGADLEADVHLSFEDALRGVTTTLRVTGAGPCDTCQGSGARPGTSPSVCPTCRGAGQVAVDQGPFSIAQPCPQCGGSGQVIDDPCPTCDGTGRQVKPREIRVRLPAGVKAGARIRLKGRGGPGENGGPSGDLFVRVSVAKHPVFGRRGDDVTLKLPITFSEAALGTRLTVPLPATSNGDQRTTTIKIPAGTASGRTFRIRGQGAPTRNGRGDLLVTVRVDVPQKLSKRQKDLLRELAQLEDTSARDRLLAGAQ